MKKLVIDRTRWKTRDDFYNAFFKSVGAPAWHGRNFDALHDSIINGQINQVELPYEVHIVGNGTMTAEVRGVVEDFYRLIKEFHAEGHKVDIVLEEQA